MKALVFCTAVFVATAANAVAQDAASPVAPEPATTRMQPLVVSGKQPGPGLWRVSKDDHDLWVLGTLAPLPKRMQWESGKVQRLVAQAQELLAEPSVSVHAKLGFFSRSEEHTSELQVTNAHLVCRLLIAKKNTTIQKQHIDVL